MNIDSFCKFLVLEGAVSQEQLDGVLEHADLQHRNIGELAGLRGWMSDEQIREVNRTQIIVDLPFGTLAVQRQYLSQAQVTELLALQQSDARQFLEYLVDYDLIDRQMIDELAAKFESNSSGLAAGATDSLVQPDVTSQLLEQMPVILRRMCQIELRLSSGVDLTAEKFGDFSVSIDLEGAELYKIGIGTDRNFSRELLRGIGKFLVADQNVFLGQEQGDLEDILMAFLKLLVVTSTSKMSYELVNPRRGIDSLQGKVYHGISNVGFISLVIDRVD